MPSARNKKGTTNTTTNDENTRSKHKQAMMEEDEDDELCQAVRGGKGKVGKELLVLQGNRPAVILDGPRSSRLRSSLSGAGSDLGSPMIASPAISKKTTTTATKTSTSNNAKAKKPFEKLLATAITDAPRIQEAKKEVPKKDVAKEDKVSKKERAAAIEEPIEARKTSSMDVDTSEKNEDPGAYEELRVKFERLSTLKHSDAEELLEQYKRTHEARAQAAESLIQALRTENAQLKAALSNATELSGGRRDSIASTISSTSTTTSTTANTSIMEVYRLMSGLEITNVASEERWKCRLSGRKGGFDFELELVDAAQGVLCYRPMFGREDRVCERLPSYLTEEIEFGVDQLQLFFWRAFNFLMSSSK